MERGFGHILFINILYFNANAVPTEFLLSLIKKQQKNFKHHRQHHLGWVVFLFVGSVIYLAQNISHNSCKMKENAQLLSVILICSGTSEFVMSRLKLAEMSVWCVFPLARIT